MPPKRPDRYYAGLTSSERAKRDKELNLRKKQYESKGTFKFPQSTDKGAKTRKSSWTSKMRRLYPDLPRDKATLAKTFRVPRSTLDKVYDRGIEAWATSGSRRGVTPYQWAWARLYRFLLIEAGHAKPTKPHPDNVYHTPKIQRKLKTMKAK